MKRKNRERVAAYYEKQSPAKAGRGDPSRVYYTYELYTILDNGEHYTYYYGKAKNGRMYDHERIYRRKLMNPHAKLDPKEKFMLFLEDHGFTLYTGVVKSGMTEDEAFNHEAELINAAGLQNLTNVAHPRRPRLIQQ